MSYSRFQLFLVSTLFVLWTVPAGAQRSGIYFDHRNNYLVPLLDRNVLAGHAEIEAARTGGGNSSLYIIALYNHLQTKVGERELQLPPGFSFEGAAFDGKDIYVRFVDENRALRYVVLDQKATVILDTTLDLKCRRTQFHKESYYQQTSILPIRERGIVDVVPLSGKGPASATVRVIAGGSGWVSRDAADKNTGSSLLFADERVVVQAVHRFTGRSVSPELRRSGIVLLDATTGSRLGEQVFSDKPELAYYPVNAAVVGNEVEVVSQFTIQDKSFSRVKYGAGIHRLSLKDGSMSRPPVMNEFTTSLLTQPGLKGRQLVSNSYLHINHALRSSNGNWYLAMQQVSKLPIKVRPLRNRSVRYELKNLCLVELNREATVVSSHQESSYGNMISVPSDFFFNPQNSGAYITAKSLSDFDFFAASDTAAGQLRYVYSNSAKDTKLRVGNVLIQEGRYEVEKFTRPPGGNTVAGILPAPIGHANLVNVDPKSGKFSFEDIRLTE